ncbi:MAG: methyltransferase domain-containing protein [Rhodocyclaceae bacterium]|nr:methyltransferase domain-containing protein [Rhodocyclaceae bacterium]
MSKPFLESVYVGPPDRFPESGCEDAFLIDFAQDLGDKDIRVESVNGRDCHWVSRRWQDISDDFGQQLLNRPFAARLLGRAPSRVVVGGVSGASLDLAKLAALFGAEVRLGACPTLKPGSRSARWLEEVERLCGPSPQPPEDDSSAAGYEHYAFSQRDHALLYEMQRPLVRHFHGCRSVLDVGCGTGLFLEALHREGIAATGVERNALSARYAQTLGHEVIQSGAFEFLTETGRRFDGVYCSHFVEHLPIEAVEQLVSQISGVLSPGGCAVFAFPDPESIRSQLLGFWRDPEHVRFYHPDLIAMIGAMHGLECEFHSHRIPGRRIVPFSMTPPPELAVATSTAEAGEPFAAEPPGRGLLGRWLHRAGLGGARIRALEGAVSDLARRLERAERREAALRGAVAQLWDVNQTWAWDDNAVLRLRKPG